MPSPDPPQRAETHVEPAPFGVRLAWRALAADEDRRDVAHALLASMLAPADPGSVRVTRQCPACGSSAHGAPVARLLNATASTSTSTADATSPPAPLISISYAPGLVAVGVAPAGALALGIDVELDSPSTRARVAEALGSARPPRAREARGAVAAWTRLEAVAKARRAGLRGAYADASFTMLGDGTWRADPSPAGADDPAQALTFHGADRRITPTPNGASAILSLACAPRRPSAQSASPTTGSSGRASA